MADLNLYEDLYGDVDAGGDDKIASAPASPALPPQASTSAAAASTAGGANASGQGTLGWGEQAPAPTTYSIATFEDSTGPSHSYRPAPNQSREPNYARGGYGDSSRAGPPGGGGGGGGYGGYGDGGAGTGGGGGDRRGGGGGGGRPGDQPDEGKIFVGGLNWETTDEGLKNYFSQFGPVVHCTIMRDGESGRSRGFAFLTFADPTTVNSVMVREHWLDGKSIDPKRALPRGGGHGASGNQPRPDGDGGFRRRNDDVPLSSNKLFVRGMADDATPEAFKAFWNQYSNQVSIMESVLMTDRETGRHRGFGFVNLETAADADKLLTFVPFVMDGNPLEVKKAQNRPRNTDAPSKPAANPAGGNAASNAAGPGTPFDPVVMAKYFQNLGPAFKMWSPAMLFGGGARMGMGMGGMQGMGSMPGMMPGMASGVGMPGMQGMVGMGGGGGFGGGQGGGGYGGGPARTQRGGHGYAPY